MHFDKTVCKLKIGDENLMRIGENCKDKYFKFVGLKLDEFISWDHQISHVLSKLANGCFVLNKCKNILPIGIRKMI